MNVMKSMFQKIVASVIGAVCCLPTFGEDSIPFINHSPAKEFVRFNAHVGVGNSFVTENYESVFPSISDLSLGSGWAFMVGATAEFSIRDYLAIGTELNILIDNYTADMIIHSEGSQSVSNVFLKNHYYYLNFPIYASVKMNLASTVRWNIDAGLYYSYGLGGHQRQTIYNAVVNDLGQQILSSYTIRTHYFKDADSFINAATRSDIGLHLATGLTFSEHYSIGVRTQIGFKNVAYTVGLNNPNIHNFSFLATAGYFF